MKVGGRHVWDVQDEPQDGVGVGILKIQCILYETDKEYILNKQ